MTVKRRRCTESVALDRLSDLPDEVLSHILSFLLTENAVQTCVLSRRWRGLFSLTTSLNFYFGLNTTAMTHVVDRVLKLHKVSIKKFYLDFWLMDSSDVPTVSAWIDSALSLGAQEFDLTLKYQPEDETQHKLLTSSAVTELKLNYHNLPENLKIPTSICLSSLHILELGGVTFPDVNSTCRFFQGCSSLKSLKLSECCWMADGGAYMISSPNLRNLCIYDGRGRYYEKMPTVVLDFPAMEYIEYHGVPRVSYHIKNSNALSTAELHISDLECKKSHGFIQLIRDLSNIKVLRLSGESMESIKQTELPTFVNLSRLEVGSPDVDLLSHQKRKGWRLIPKLLTLSPALETLVFKEGFYTCYDELGASIEERKDPFSSNLITIQVNDYSGCKKEYRMVKLFLKRGAFNVKQLIMNKAKRKSMR